MPRPTWRPQPWYWAAWLFAIIVTFAVPEGYALHNGGTTFSAFMWGTTTAWPLWEFLWGLLIGGLAVHFWWHWNPPGTLTGTGG
jgi:hypothetical protein